jgi:aminoglycoside phosphotransferase (APT) family kinase protein
VVAHHERATVRVGDSYVKVDADDSRLSREVAAFSAASPVPHPMVLWREPHVLAMRSVPGRQLARLGEPSAAGPAAWRAAGRVARQLHTTPPPAWAAPVLDVREQTLAAEGAWLVDRGLASRAVVDRMAARARPALRPFEATFVHGDFQAAHVFVDGDEVTGVIDWADAGLGDPLADLAVLTAGHSEWLDAVLEGYGVDVDREVIGGWWAVGKLRAVRWMVEHGFDAAGDIAELHRFAADGPS